MYFMFQSKIVLALLKHGPCDLNIITSLLMHRYVAVALSFSFFLTMKSQRKGFNGSHVVTNNETVGIRRHCCVSDGSRLMNFT